MPKVTTEQHGKFTKRITQNDIAPKDGSEPLTVIEFSLTNEVRDSLKVALDEYRAGPKDRSMLGRIIHDHFPSQVLEELGSLAKEGGAPATVYVVKNLPQDTIPKNLENGKDARSHDTALIRWGEKAYTALVGEGVGAVLNLQSEDWGYQLIRRAGEAIREPQTLELHKHKDAISMMSGILADGSETRFTDMQAILEDQNQKQFPVVSVSELDVEHDPSPLIRLNELQKVFPKWKKAMDMILSPATWRKENVPANAAIFEKLVDKHSQRVVAGAGDLVMWAEDSRMLHQGLPSSQHAEPKGTLLRYIEGHTFSRPQNLSR